MSRDSLDMLLDEYDAWSTERQEISIRSDGDPEKFARATGKSEDDFTPVVSDDWVESDEAGLDLLRRLVGEVSASHRVLPHATSVVPNADDVAFVATLTEAT